MKFISEQEIDAAGEQLDASEEALEEGINEMQEEQPVLLGYCFSENFDAFTPAEKSYMLFLVLVIWKAVRNTVGSLSEVEEEMISKAEEANWELFMENKTKDFRHRLTPFFENTAQEDLLAFIEDALSEDQETEGLVTQEGRAALFISLKTVADCLELAAS